MASSYNGVVGWGGGAILAVNMLWWKERSTCCVTKASQQNTFLRLWWVKKQPIFSHFWQWKVVRWSELKMNQGATWKEKMASKSERDIKWKKKKKSRWQMKDGSPCGEALWEINCYRNWLDGDRRKSNRGVRQKYRLLNRRVTMKMHSASKQSRKCSHPQKEV